jgi:hypothetical protein
MLEDPDPGEVWGRDQHRGQGDTQEWPQQALDQAGSMPTNVEGKCRVAFVIKRPVPFGISPMQLEDEVVGIRRRRAELERALLRLDDGLALTLVRAVIAALEASTQPRDGAVKPA